MDHIFGPVLSRRLGLSLGVDLLPLKTCSMDCNYCEIGQTTCLTMERKRYVSEERVLREIRSIAGVDFDYLTFAGSGEPTLNSGLGSIIKAAKKIIDQPIVVITNSSLFALPEVRAEVSQADLVLPSLDAVTQKTFDVINRPAPGLRIEDIIQGLKAFRREFSGEIWLEVMLVKDVNDHEAPLIADAANAIDPDRTQLNTVVRPPPEPVLPLTEDEMASMLDIFPGAEIIPDWEWDVPPGAEKELIFALSQKEMTVEDMELETEIDMVDLMKYLKILEREEKVVRSCKNGKLYFRSAKAL